MGGLGAMRWLVLFIAVISFPQALGSDYLRSPGAESSAGLPWAPALFVFGDSTVDAGTNSLFPSLLQAKWEPYGSTYFGKPTGRFTNGRTVADFWASKLWLPFPKPYLDRNNKRGMLKGVNFASGGSGVFQETNQANHVIPFPDQIKQFQFAKSAITETLKSAKLADDLISDAFYVISIGGNDLVTYFLANSGVPVAEFLSSLVSVIETSLGELYKAGARKFVLVGPGAAGCVPFVVVLSGVREGSCVESVNELSRTYEAALENLVLKTLPAKYENIKVVLTKPYQSFLKFITENDKGFTGKTSACCGSGRYNAEAQCGYSADLIGNPPFNVCKEVEKYVFWDYFHPTERAYEIAANRAWDGDEDVTVPYNIKTLLSK